MENTAVWLSENWYLVVTTIISVASIVAAGTETPDPNSRLGKAYKIIDLVAINVGKAKQLSPKERAWIETGKQVDGLAVQTESKSRASP